MFQNHMLEMSETFGPELCLDFSTEIESFIKMLVSIQKYYSYVSSCILEFLDTKETIWSFFALIY